MKFNVHLLSSSNSDVREVVIPDGDDRIDAILKNLFIFGQNDVQPVPGKCSVSVGDVAEVDGGFHLCVPFGWEEVSEDWLEDYRLASADYRWYTLRRLWGKRLRPRP